MPINHRCQPLHDLFSSHCEHCYLFWVFFPLLYSCSFVFFFLLLSIGKISRCPLLCTVLICFYYIIFVLLCLFIHFFYTRIFFTLFSYIFFIYIFNCLTLVSDDNIFLMNIHLLLYSDGIFYSIPYSSCHVLCFLFSSLILFYVFLCF